MTKEFYLVVAITALITTLVAVSLSYFVFSQRNAFELYNKGKIVCFTSNKRCFKAVPISEPTPFPNYGMDGDQIKIAK